MVRLEGTLGFKDSTNRNPQVAQSNAVRVTFADTVFPHASAWGYKVNIDLDRIVEDKVLEDSVSQGSGLRLQGKY
jgi:hypothetical protein